MTPLTESALGLAAQGIPVFPLGRSKRPLAGSNGFKDATTDRAAILRAFAAPLATLIGVPTGAASGIDVLDVDPEKGGDEWFRANEHRLPPTCTHHTRRPGGFHKLFKHAAGLRCSMDNPARGVDIRADLGYAVWWPAAGNYCNETPLAEWPGWLLIDVMREQTRVKAAAANPEDLAPPDADSLIALLANMPNPESAGRGDYVAVCLAVQGCIRGLVVHVIDSQWKFRIDGSAT